MSEMKLVIEFCPEDRARLDAILEELKSSRPNCERCVSTMSESWKNATASAQHPVDAVPPATVEDVAPAPVPAADPGPAIDPAPAPAADPAPAVDPAPATEEEKYTLDKVRSAVMTASRKSPEMKKKVKALLNQYSESVTKLPEADYPAFMTDLKKLTEEAV